MKRWRRPVPLFFLAVGAPFLLAVTFFVASQREALFTEPDAYIELLDRTGHLSQQTRIPTWKHYLARDSRCRRAEVLIIGSSRMREIDSDVVGSSSCNLYVDGLRALGFKHLAQTLPVAAPERSPVVYAGIDHFWFFWADTSYGTTLELALLERSRPLWRAWATVRVLDFLSINDLKEVARRYRHAGSADNEWYPDGHLYHPQYYALKRRGVHVRLTTTDADRSADELFEGAQVRNTNLHDFETAVRLLHGKGYRVRAFWTPVSPAHIAAARRRFPGPFQQTIDAVDRLAAELPLDRYLSASETLDGSRFGCTERDYVDPTHADVDCMRRLFRTVFPTDEPPPGKDGRQVSERAGG